MLEATNANERQLCISFWDKVQFQTDYQVLGGTHLHSSNNVVPELGLSTKTMWSNHKVTFVHLL